MATKKTTAKKAANKPSVNKKTTSKKTVVKKSTVQLDTDTAVNTSPKTTQKPESHKRFFIPLMLILLIGLVYFIATQFVVATVNYRPITRLALLKAMEEQIGKQTLENLVTEALITQEASKKKIIINSAEIDKQIADIEKRLTDQGQTLDQVLVMQGMTKDDLMSQIRLQLIVDKLVGEVEITEEEINEFVQQQSQYLDANADETQIRNDAREYLRQQKIGEKADALIQQIKKDASIQYFGSFKTSETEPELSVTAPTEE